MKVCVCTYRFQLLPANQGELMIIHICHVIAPPEIYHFLIAQA